MQSVKPQVNGVPNANNPIGEMQSAGNSLYGVYYAYPQTYKVMVSTDGAHTWLPVPIQPASVASIVLEGVTPDGTVIIIAYRLGPTGGQGSGTSDIESLTPGASAWQSIAQLAQAGMNFRNFATISWDPNGHPLALWAMIDHAQTSTQPFPDTYGLAYHAATP
jgi:hypothetical protein